MAVTNQSKTSRGTEISSEESCKVSVIGTINNPSLAIVATARYLITSLTIVTFLEGRVPCLRWACVRLRFGQFDWISIQTERVVNGTDFELLRISFMSSDLTTDSSV